MRSKYCPICLLCKLPMTELSSIHHFPQSTLHYSNSSRITCKIDHMQVLEFERNITVKMLACIMLTKWYILTATSTASRWHAGISLPGQVPAIKTWAQSKQQAARSSSGASSKQSMQAAKHQAARSSSGASSSGQRPAAAAAEQAARSNSGQRAAAAEEASSGTSKQRRKRLPWSLVLATAAERGKSGRRRRLESGGGGDACSIYSVAMKE